MTYTTRLIGIAIGIAVLFSMFSAASAQTPTPDTDFGERMYLEKCQNCHGPEGQGIGMPNQPDFNNRSFWRANSKESLIASVMDGKGAMPGFEGDSITVNENIIHFSEEEIVDVLAHESGEFGDIDWSQVGRAAAGGATQTVTPTATGTQTPSPGLTAALAIAGFLAALGIVLIRRE